MMNNLPDLLSENLKTYRKLKGFSQEELSERASCSKSVVRDIEAKRRGASLEMLSKLAEALNIDLAQLLMSNEKIEHKAINFPVSKALSKMQSIPDEIYDLAQQVGNDKDIWDAVEGTILGLLSTREKKALKKNQA